LHEGDQAICTRLEDNIVGIDDHVAIVGAGGCNEGAVLDLNALSAVLDESRGRVIDHAWCYQLHWERGPSGKEIEVGEETICRTQAGKQEEQYYRKICHDSAKIAS